MFLARLDGLEFAYDSLTEPTAFDKKNPFPQNHFGFFCLLEKIDDISDEMTIPKL